MNKIKHKNIISKICYQRYNAYPSAVSAENYLSLVMSTLDDFCIEKLKINPEEQTYAWNSEIQQKYEDFLLCAYRNKKYAKTKQS